MIFPLNFYELYQKFNKTFQINTIGFIISWDYSFYQTTCTLNEHYKTPLKLKVTSSFSPISTLNSQCIYIPINSTNKL